MADLRNSRPGPVRTDSNCTEPYDRDDRELPIRHQVELTREETEEHIRSRSNNGDVHNRELCGVTKRPATSETVLNRFTSFYKAFKALPPDEQRSLAHLELSPSTNEPEINIDSTSMTFSGAFQHVQSKAFGNPSVTKMAAESFPVSALSNESLCQLIELMRDDMEDYRQQQSAQTATNQQYGDQLNNLSYWTPSDSLVPDSRTSQARRSYHKETPTYAGALSMGITALGSMLLLQGVLRGG